MDDFDNGFFHTLMAITHSTLYQIGEDELAVEIPGVGGTLTGTPNDPFGTAIINGKYCFSQGVDKIMTFSFLTTDETIGQLTGTIASQTWMLGEMSGTFRILSPDAPACRYLLSYNGRLLAIHTTEEGTVYPYRVRWSKFNDETNWTALSSGFLDMDSTGEELTGAAALPGSVYLFKTNTIIPGSETGIAKGAYAFDERASLSPGTVAGQSLQLINGGWTYLGPDDLYWFNGNRPIPLMLDKRRLDMILSINSDRYRFIYAVNDVVFQTYRLYVPMAGQDYPGRVICWYYREFLQGRGLGRFYDEEFPWLVPAAAYHPKQSGATTISQLIGTIAEQTWTLGGSALTSNFPMLYEGSHASHLYKQSLQASTDNGTKILSEAHTKDFTALDLLKHQSSRAIPSEGVGITAFRVVVYYRCATSTTLTLSFSHDGGASWEDSETQTLTAGGQDQVKKAYFDLIETSEQVRYRLIHDDLLAPITILGIEPQFIAATETQ
jgi:hypothetical protein